MSRTIEEALGEVRPASVERWRPSFWRNSQYPTYEEAKRQGGVYEGEVCYGTSSFLDAMCNVRAAMRCCNGAWEDEGLMVRILADGNDIGDFELSKEP